MVGRKCGQPATQPVGRCVDTGCMIVNNLSQLYFLSDMSDVELKVSHRIFKAHRLVLSMTSSVFRTMLMDSKWSDAHKNQVPLFEELECEEVFDEFLAYLYSGKINISNVNALPILMLADKYDISTLSKECLLYMQNNCAAYPQHIKVVSWFQYATLCNYDSLARECAHSIKHNFDSVVHSEDFVTMRLSTLENLLHSDDLVVADEYTLYKAVERWLLHNTETLEMGTVAGCRKSKQEKKLLAQLMSYIRFPLMEAHELAQIESSNFYVKNSDILESMLRLGWISQMLEVRSSTRCISGMTLLGLPPARRVTASSSLKNCSVGIHSLCQRHGESSRSSCKSVEDSLKQVKVDVEGYLRPFNPFKEFEDLTLSMDSLRPDFLASSVHGARDCLGLKCSTGKSVWRFEHLIPGNSRPPSFPWHAHSHLFLPRNYISQYWSMELDIRNFNSVSRYSSFVYIFSSPRSIVPLQEGSMLEWEAVLHPKGVHFPAALMIGIPYSFDIPEYHEDTVRLSVTCKTALDRECCVEITLLVIAHTEWSEERSVEYIDQCVSKSCIFDQTRPCHNIDHILPIECLTEQPSKYVAPRSNGYFKLLVVIKPTEL